MGTRSVSQVVSHIQYASTGCRVRDSTSIVGERPHVICSERMVKAILRMEERRIMRWGHFKSLLFMPMHLLPVTRQGLRILTSKHPRLVTSWVK